MIGQAIGAGILALPLVSFCAGFVPALLVLFAAWMIMTIGELLILEVSLAVEGTECGFSSMAEKTLGTGGKMIVWVITPCFLYALTSMYIAGTSSVLTGFLNSQGITLPSFMITAVFALIFGGVVFCGTRSTDYTNRLLMSIKCGVLIGAIVSLLPYVHRNYLLSPPTPVALFGEQGVAGMALVFLSAMNSCTVVPTLRTYNNDNPQRMKHIIFLGTTIPMIIYLCWLVVTLGVVPQTGIQSFATIDGSVGRLIRAIVLLTNNRLTSICITTFTNITMTVSFLGSALALVDFLVDGFKLQKARGGRLLATVIALIPPCIFAVFYPEGFLFALRYVSVFAAVLAIILPAIMAYRLRNNLSIRSPYRVLGGNALLIVLCFIGCLIIVAQLF